MSLFFVIALAVAAMIISLAMMVGSIWLAGRVWQVPDVSWQRAALATLWLSLGSWLVWGAACFALLNWVAPESAGPGIVVCLIALAMQLGLIVQCVGRPLRTSAIKAVCVTLTAYAAQSVIGLVLALGCRERLLEAFVLPAGSMAPTLYGAHFDVTCPNCGHAFAVNASQRQDLHLRRPEEIATCENCGIEIPIPMTAQVASGDRVLVDKTVAARRWDCVPFHTPSPGRQNYIKRIVGLPGENVELAGGDLFIDGRRIRKHPRQQADLWLPRHDTKSIPKQREDETPRWQPMAAESSWTEGSDGGWNFNGPMAAADALEFRGEITDTCEYNVQLSPGPNYRHVSVGDIRVRCNVTKFSGPGSLQFVWQFGGADLRFSVSRQGAQIANNDGPLASNEAGEFIRPGEPLEFAIRDGTAYLLCGQDEVSASFLPDSLESAKNESAAPDNPCRIRLIAEQCRIEIARVRIDRDIYYLNREDFGRRIGYMGDEGKEFSSQLGADEYFMLGDNVLASKDSRFIGPIPARDLIGVARWRYWPGARWHALD